MTMTMVLWLLIAIGGHGYYTVPGISSQQECERLFQTLYEARWALQGPGDTHKSVSYEGVRP
jgi:hypothetical protein